MMRWKVEIFGETIRELECNPNVSDVIEDVTGYRWEVLPVVLVGERREVKAIRRTVAALLANRLGLTQQDALAKVDGLKTHELLATVTEDEDDLPTVLEDGFPQSADEPSTPG